MAEHPSEGPRRRKYSSPRARRRAVVGLVVAFIFVAVMTGLFYEATQSGLTPESGVVHLAGLAAPVKVIRDAAGVPHIYAQNRLDLTRALGYTQAQDRLFQLEMRRRMAVWPKCLAPTWSKATTSIGCSILRNSRAIASRSTRPRCARKWTRSSA